MKNLIFIVLLLWATTLQAQNVREANDLLEEGNDGYATWSFQNQNGETAAPDSACFYVYDEASVTQQYTTCNSNPDDIHQFPFTPCATRIIDDDNNWEAKLFTLIWEYPDGTPVLTGQRTYRVWVSNSRSVAVNSGTCAVEPQ